MFKLSPFADSTEEIASFGRSAKIVHPCQNEGGHDTVANLLAAIFFGGPQSLLNQMVTWFLRLKQAIYELFSSELAPS